MFRTVFSLLAAAIFFLCTNVFAQLAPVTGEDQLSRDRVRLDFERYQTGTPGAELFGQWGVHFTSSGPGTLVLDSITLGLIGSETVFLSHDATVQAGLVVDFVAPLEEVAFELRGLPETVARLTAFDGLGNHLGFVEKTSLNADEETFFGLTTNHPGGIRKVILDYGDSVEPEKVVTLFFTLKDRNPFFTYLAQVADGKLPSGSLATVIVISNLANTVAEGELTVLGDDGTPLEFEFTDGIKASKRPLLVAANASQKLVTTGATSPPAQGYIRIESNVPMEATAIFQILDAQGLPVSEAGVGSSAGSNQMVAVVSKEAGKQFDSGIAVVNIGSAPARGVIQLIRPDGSLESSNQDFLELEPGEHDADFLDQMFPGLFNRNFDGTLLIRSDQALAVVVLRTIRGLVLSSLPVGTMQR